MVCYIKGIELLEALPNAKETNVAPSACVNGVFIDSRQVNSGGIFFAIKGKVHDGHEFVDVALKRGARIIVVEDLTEEIKSAAQAHDAFYIQVPDTIAALQQLAAYRRNNVLSSAKVIAITGSLGKTSVSRAMGIVLSRFFQTDSSAKSFNNHIGMPLTLANASNETKIIVLEMGMNHAGEIDLLGRIAQPDIAVITTIAPVHIGNFEDGIDGIIAAKTEIFDHLKPNGVVLLNEDGEHFRKLKEIANAKGIKNIFCVGQTAKSHIFLSHSCLNSLGATEFEMTAREKSGNTVVKGTFNGIGEHNIINLAFVFMVARMFKIDLKMAASIISSLSPVEGRGNIEYISFDKKKVTLINDCYSSNPVALHRSIEILEQLMEVKGASRSVCILGDMLELGSYTEEYHKAILPQLEASKIDTVITVGENMHHLFELLPETFSAVHFAHVGLLIKKIRSLLQDGDMILIKGSRSMYLNQAVDKLYQS